MNGNNNSIPIPQKGDIKKVNRFLIGIGLFVIALIVVSFWRHSFSSVTVNKPDVTFQGLPEGMNGHELLVQRTICHVFWDMDGVDRLTCAEIDGFPLAWAIRVQMGADGLNINRLGTCGIPAIDAIIDAHIANWVTNANAFSLSWDGWRNAYSNVTFLVRVFPGCIWNVEVLNIGLNPGATPYTPLQFYGPSQFAQFWRRCLPFVFGAAPTSIQYDAGALGVYQNINNMYVSWKGHDSGPAAL